MIYTKEGIHMTKIDYKKVYKDLYLPKSTPMIIEVPPISFVAVSGFGDPNEKDGEYQRAIQILYGISYTIKMSYKSNTPINDYFDYSVPPLEGLWWMKNEEVPSFRVSSKKDFQWLSMIRLPEFVDQAVFDWACEEFSKKHPDIDMSATSILTYDEGLCAQVIHIGSYDNEGYTIEFLNTFIKDIGYECDYDGLCLNGMKRKHHEIYLGDPRRAKPENLKTVLRLPIRKDERYYECRIL